MCTRGPRDFAHCFKDHFGEFPQCRAAASWLRAERLLAAELLAIVDDDEELPFNIQCHVLIPLETALIDSETTEDLTASGLVLSVSAALRSSL